MTPAPRNTWTKCTRSIREFSVLRASRASRWRGHEVSPVRPTESLAQSAADPADRRGGRLRDQPHLAAADVAGRHGLDVERVRLEDPDQRHERGEPRLSAALRALAEDRGPRRGRGRGELDMVGWRS